MPPPGLNIAVCFGGPSVEHDVSVISALQLMAALEARHRVTPVYLARDGRFWTGDALRDVASFAGGVAEVAEPCELRLGGRSSLFVVPATSRLKRERDIPVDAVINAIHGTGGEDGALLGALELSSIPYVGGGVGPAATAMDKALAKLVFASAGIDVLTHVLVHRDEIAADASAAAARVVDAVGLPCYAKPVSLGSSIGVTRCGDAESLEEALVLCAELDRRAMVEPALDDAAEINAAVLGGSSGDLQVSVLEQPLRDSGAALSFEDKYLRGGKAAGAKGTGATKLEAPEGGMASQERIIPAPVSEELARRLRSTVETAHRALGFAGVVRYDFLVGSLDDPDTRIVLNEANTVPGSFAFYLFEPAGIDFTVLADRLIDIAFAEAAEVRATTRTFDSILIDRHAQSGRR